MTDPTQEPEPTPLSLIQRLRLEASDLTSTYVLTDSHGDPIERPGDGSEEADFDDPLDPVEFEPEQLRDLANLFREAATALVAQASELASRDERIALLESQIGATRGSLDALHTVLTGLLNAEPALDLEVFPVDPTTGEHKLEGEGGLEMAARLLLLAAERGAFRQAARPGQKLEAVDARFVEIHFLAEPCRVGLRFEGVPFDVRVPNADAKALPFAEAEPGATGLELLWSLALKWAQEDKVDLTRALACITAGPARVLGASLAGLQDSVGHLAIGAEADVVVLSAQGHWPVTESSLRSQGKSTPFSGYELPGRVLSTLVAGHVVFEAA